MHSLLCCYVQERDKALAALECVRADLRRRDDTISQLSTELKAAHSQSTSLREQVEELERSREELIDRVERLYAEKHKLEDRVAHAGRETCTGPSMLLWSVSFSIWMLLATDVSPVYVMSRHCLPETSTPHPTPSFTRTPHPTLPPPSLLHLTSPHPLPHFYTLTSTPHPTPHVHTSLHPLSLWEWEYAEGG